MEIRSRLGRLEVGWKTLRSKDFGEFTNARSCYDSVGVQPIKI